MVGGGGGRKEGGETQEKKNQEERRGKRMAQASMVKFVKEKKRYHYPCPPERITPHRFSRYNITCAVWEGKDLLVRDIATVGVDRCG